jgi:hypothetical protein
MLENVNIPATIAGLKYYIDRNTNLLSLLGYFNTVNMKMEPAVRDKIFSSLEGPLVDEAMQIGKLWKKEGDAAVTKQYGDRASRIFAALWSISQSDAAQSYTKLLGEYAKANPDLNFANVAQVSECFSQALDRFENRQNLSAKKKNFSTTKSKSGPPVC